MSIVIALIEAIQDRGTFDDWTYPQNLDVLLSILKGEVKYRGQIINSPVEDTIWNLLNLSGVIDQVEYHISQTLNLVGKPPETPLL